ncbi:MAG: hypothetical protein P8M10_07220 [Ilumatobacter sp.]|nr:hypothetical protein [Ilumatobacter sp.]MDG1695285.1 hypothetical protein [Ilumatobacter sp.]MDG2439090.1 hypothetical protein [Ilumatobacter sp.]
MRASLYGSAVMVKPSRNDGDLASRVVHHHIHPTSSSNRQGAQRGDHDVAVGFIAGVVPVAVNKVAAMTELIAGSLMFRLTSDATFRCFAVWLLYTIAIFGLNHLLIA